MTARAVPSVLVGPGAFLFPEGGLWALVPARYNLRMASKARDRILQAAVEQFAAHGFDGVSAHDIAVAAVVHDATLFRIFGSKETLFAATFDAVVLQAVNPIPRHRALLDPNWKHALLRYAHVVRDAWDDAGARVLLYGCIERGLYPRYVELVRPAVSAMRQRLEMLMADGLVKRTDPYYLAESILTLAMSLYVFQRIHRDERQPAGLDPNPDRDTVFSMFVSGLDITGNASSNSHSG